MMNKGFFILATLMVAGCGWQQDPLAKKADEIRNAVPPGGPISSKPDAEPSDSIVIDRQTSVTVLEDSQAKVEFKVRLISGDYQMSELVVENLNSFKGATFDKGVFTWSVPRGTVDNGQLQKNFNISVRAWARNTKIDKKITRQADVTLIVQKNPTDPMISSLQMPGTRFIREGDNFAFKVEVKDVDGATGSGQGPTLEILAARGANISLAPFITMDSVISDANTQTWTFTFKLNLYGAELTKSSDSAGFNIQATSQFGRRSAVTTWTTKILTKLDELKTNWTSNRQIFFNQRNTIPFLVFDSKGEARISMGTNAGLPTGATVNCAEAGPGVMACEFNYHPTGDPKSFPSTGVFRVDFAGRNVDSSDPNVTSKTINFPFQMVVAP